MNYYCCGVGGQCLIGGSNIFLILGCCQCSQFYLMGRRCLFSLGCPPFQQWCHNKSALWGRCFTSTSFASHLFLLGCLLKLNFLDHLRLNSTKGSFMVDRSGKCFIFTNNFYIQKGHSVLHFTFNCKRHVLLNVLVG